MRGFILTLQFKLNEKTQAAEPAPTLTKCPTHLNTDLDGLWSPLSLNQKERIQPSSLKENMESYYHCTESDLSDHLAQRLM